MRVENVVIDELVGQLVIEPKYYEKGKVGKTYLLSQDKKLYCLQASSLPLVAGYSVRRKLSIKF